MSDLLFEDLSTVQSEKNALPATIASAATISPKTRFTRITGTTPITKIVPPVSGYCELILVFTSAFATALNTGGSGPGAIATAVTSVADRPIPIYYDPRTTLWYVGTVV